MRASPSRFPGRFRLGPAHGGGDPPLGPPAQRSRDSRAASARRRPSLRREGERLRARRASRGARPRGGWGADAGRGHGGRRVGVERGGDPPPRRRAGGCRPAAGGGGPRPRTFGDTVRPGTDRLPLPARRRGRGVPSRCTSRWTRGWGGSDCSRGRPWRWRGGSRRLPLYGWKGG